MNQIIYLRVDRRGVQGMTKSLPNLYKDEIIVKLNLEVDNKAFGVPTIEQNVIVNDWSSDIDIQDVRFEQHVITQDESDMIRERRLERMREILESQGYTISKDEAIEDEQ